MWIFWACVTFTPIYILGVHVFGFIPTYEDDLASSQAELLSIRTDYESANPSITIDAEVLAGRAALQSAADGLATVPGIEVVGVTGDPILNQDTLSAFIDAMLMSLPVAILLATALAWLVMRSWVQPA